MNSRAVETAPSYLLKPPPQRDRSECATSTTRVEVTTLGERPHHKTRLNDIGVVKVETTQPLVR